MIKMTIGLMPKSKDFDYGKNKEGFLAASKNLWVRMAMATSYHSSGFWVKQAVLIVSLTSIK